MPATGRGSNVVTTDPQTVVVEFLDALAASDLERAMSLLAEDVEYVNVGLPPVHGRRRVASAFKGLLRPSVSFDVCNHAIAADGPVVLTERTDAISLGPFRTQFWVWGRFEVHDGLITLWRDSFDSVDITRSVVRGLVGVVVPAVRPTMPSASDAPGR